MYYSIIIITIYAGNLCMLDIFNSIFKNKNYNYMVDLHSHLLPGIDDGAKNMKESIELIVLLKDLGFKKLITTPHIMKHRFANSSEIILRVLGEVKDELQKQNIEIELEAAAEYYLDEHFMELLENKDILTFGENYVLFEMSYVNKPVNLESSIFEMGTSRYKPVLAHPERYMFMHKDIDSYKNLKDRGVLFQVNLNSFSGYYSKEAQAMAFKLAKEGLIDFIGSDTHKIKHLEHFKRNISSSVMNKIFSKNTILNEKLL